MAKGETREAASVASGEFFRAADSFTTLYAALHLTYRSNALHNPKTKMKASELFGVAVRTVGLVSLIYMLGGALVLFGVRMSFGFVVKELLWLALSLYLLRGAPHVIRFAYGRSDE